jgi:hypothetical protein
LSAGAFLQGTAFIDANQDHMLDPGDPYLPGAIVSLYQGTTVSPGTLLATATTDVNGAYLFDNANVPTSYGQPGLNPGQYTLVETPPADFVNDATQVLSQLNPATAVNASTIQVTLLDPAQIFFSFNSTQFFNRNAWDLLQQDINNVTHRETAGQFPVTPVNANDLTLETSSAGVTNKSVLVTLSDTSGLSVGQAVKLTDGTTTLYSVIAAISPNTSITLTDTWTGSTGNAASLFTLGTLNSPFLTLCWDLQHFLADGTNVFQVLPTSGQGTPPNAGRIAYLYNHNGTVDISTLTGTNPNTGLLQGTSAQAVGLQVAIWDLVYGASFTNLLVISKQHGRAPAVVAQELMAINTWATFYVNDSIGKSETATFLQVVGAPLQGGFQGMLATGSLNFGNVPQGGHKDTPALVTVPAPTTVTLGTSAVTLTDAAVLSAGNNPTGTITFTLFVNGGIVPVDTETVNVLGNGTYTTPNGFTLPTSGVVTGTYQWNASYSGDSNNNAVSDNGNTNEQVTVSPASPAITTTPSPTMVTLGTTSVTLTDSAVLSGGYAPTGTITFTLLGPGGGTVDTETVNVSGNGTYTTPAGFTLPTSGTVIGTYQWDASYGGDTNNNAVSDQGNANELVTVSPAAPSITTSASAGGTVGQVTLNDTADLEGGYHPTGTITFTLTAPNNTVAYTQTVAVNGNGLYSTSPGVVAMQAGTYEWSATYSGDTNNISVTSAAGSEPVTVIGIPIIIPNIGGKVLLLSSVWTSNTSPQPLMAFTLFVNGLYQKLLHRAPDQNEINAWVAQLAAGISPEQVASTIYQSPEHRGLQVDGYFQTFLGRSPGPAERSGWISFFLGGATETSVEETILLSPEYQALHAGNAALVAGLFNDLLGRPVTPAEQAVWVQALQQGLSSAGLVQLLLNSTEYLERAVGQDYSQFLGRDASPQEALNWASLLQNSNASLGFVAEQLFGSAEFFAHPI